MESSLSEITFRSTTTSRSENIVRYSLQSKEKVISATKVPVSKTTQGFVTTRVRKSSLSDIPALLFDLNMLFLTQIIVYFIQLKCVDLDADTSKGRGKIEDQMNNENLVMLQKIFEVADEDGGGGLDIEEFRQAMKMAFGNVATLDNKQLELMFMKVDTNCDGTVDWEEFISYMLLENQQKDSMSRESIDLPFPHPAREIKSPHHDTISRIAFFALTVTQQQHPLGEDFNEETNGRYVSCGKDGVLAIWNLDLKVQRTVHLNDLNSSASKTKQIWVTDMVCLPNVKKIVVASTERDLIFFDCSANNFDKQFIVTGLEHCALCLDYWYNPQNINECYLLFGDAGGSVACIMFTHATVGLFDVTIRQKKNMSTSTVRKIPFLELFSGRHPNVSAVLFNSLHDDWVRKVKYIPNLQCFISCSNTNETSLYLGDLHSKKMKSFFKVRKGVYTFDYDKGNNVIVSGGLDRFIRIWNPYVTSKATCVLKGHHSPVSHIITEGDQIISISKDKVIKIWDANDHYCIQTIPRRFTEIGAHAIGTVFYNRKMRTLILGTNTIAVLDKKATAEPFSGDNIQRTHPKPLCGALYNDLFNQVVSACHGSVVNVWHVYTGEKVILFANAHDGHEITAMSFDPTKRRLMTGSRNGTVKIWNFNNGACLRELGPIDDGEITGIVCPKQKILTVGWNHKITVYRDVKGAEEDPPRLYNNLHKDDILAVDFMNSSSIATASYDGKVTCWNIDTGHTYCQININKALQIQSQSLHLNANVEPNQSVKALTSPTSSRPQAEAVSKHLSVDKVLFLRSREPTKDTATLLISVEGKVQAWSTHGNLLGQFDITGSLNDDSVLAMATDQQNHILLTGDSAGYIKIWDISEYCLKERNAKNKKSSRCASPLDRIPTRRSPLVLQSFLRPPEGTSSAGSNPSRRSLSSGSMKSDTHLITICTPPQILVSFRGHCQSIVSIQYAEDKDLIVTASTDCCVRLWTVNGRYIGTFGQKKNWESLENPNSLKKLRIIPRDLQRVASSHTLNVINGSIPKWKLTKNIFAAIGRRSAKHDGKGEEEFSQSENETDDETNVYTKTGESNIAFTNILGKNYKSKHRHRMPPIIKPSIKQLQCVAFTALPFCDLEVIEETKMPRVLTNILLARQQQQQQEKLRNNSPNSKRKHSPMRQLTTNKILPLLILKKPLC